MELTLRKQKTIFLSLFVSGTQTTSKNYGKIHASLFWKEEDVEAKEASKRKPEGRKRVPHAPMYLAAWAHLFWASGLRSRRSFLRRLRLELKTSIKKVPRRSLEGAPHKHKNTETEIRSCRLEGENSDGTLPAWSPSTSPPSP